MSALRVLTTGAVAALTALSGCSGGSGSSGPTYTVGGTVLGLESGGTVDVVLGSETLAETANGTFTFPNAVANDTSFTVTVGATMPAGQSCDISNGAGEISSDNVTDIEVYCTYDVSNATLDGTYEIAAFDINSDTDQLYTAVPFDGNGTEGSSTVVTDQAGTTFTTSTADGGTYSITTAEALPALAIGTDNVGAIAGQDGDEFYWIEDDVAGGSPPILFVGVNPLPTATLSTLAGNWTTVGLTQAATPYDSEQTIAIGADGSFSGSQSTLDSNGVASTQAVSGPAGSYTVAGGVVSIGGQSGYISANGEFAMLASVTQPIAGAGPNYPSLTVAVKPGSGVTLATLSGVYSLGTMLFESASIGAASSITLYFDGAGNFSGTAQANVNGTYNFGNYSGTYTVTSSGVLTLTDSSGEVYTGAVSADGNIVVATYLTAGATVPQIFVGFRE